MCGSLQVSSGHGLSVCSTLYGLTENTLRVQITPSARGGPWPIHYPALVTLENKPVVRAWLALVLRGFKRLFALSDSHLHLLPSFCAADKKKNELVHELQLGLKFLRRPAHFAQFIAYKRGCDLQNYCWLFEFPAFLPGEKQSLPAAIREHFISTSIHYLYFEQKHSTCCHK